MRAIPIGMIPAVNASHCTHNLRPVYIKCIVLVRKGVCHGGAKFKNNQCGFAVYIKLLELQYTLSFLRRHPGMRLMGSGKQLSADFFQGDNADTFELLDEMMPFSGPKERARIENIKNMIMNLKKMQEMMEMIQMLQELFPEGMGGDNPMDMFSGMSDSGLSSIFQMFGGDSSE